MKSLSILILLVVFSLFTVACSDQPLFKKSHIYKFIPEISITSSTSITNSPPIEKAETYNINELTNLCIKYHPMLFAIAALLFLWMVYRGRRAGRKCIKLDNEDIAILSLAADTLSDFLYRIRSKTKNKIIPFPRGN